MSIQERQNTAESISKLASQRFLYSCAKRTRVFEMCLIVLIVFLGLVSSAVEISDLSQWVPLVVLLAWIVDQFLLKRKENSFKTEAAIVQEDFDCFVLDLVWPEYKGIERPTPDRLRQLDRLAAKRSVGSASLLNWYGPSGMPCDPFHAKIHCQKINCWWDANLRRRWRNLLYWASGSFVVAAVILCIVNGITVTKLVALVASSIGVLRWGVAEIIDQMEAGQQANKLHKFLTGLSRQEQISPSEVRSVQDEIFELRRKGPLVPDWFYNFSRDDQESEATGT